MGMRTLLAKYKKNEDGQAVLETALVLPIILLILFGMLTFGMLLYSKIVVTLAASQSARLGATLYSEQAEEAGNPDERIKSTADAYLQGLSGNSEIAIQADPPPAALPDGSTPAADRNIAVTIRHHFSFTLPFVGKFIGDDVPVEYTAIYKIE